MLIEIKSEVFREKVITFHRGLNVVIGCEIASNSIGKSNLLLIIDFVFGGDAYSLHSKDVIRELGDHEFRFCFEFGGVKYFFIRNTSNISRIFFCNYKYKKIKEQSVDDFNIFLQRKYRLNYYNSTFRSLTSTYSRIWGKDNYDIKKPLKSFRRDNKDQNGIDNLIKLFNKYDSLFQINQKIKDFNSSSKLLNAMFSHSYVRKITKSEYNKNKVALELIAQEIENFKENIVNLITNYEDMVNSELLDLRRQKNRLIDSRDNYQDKLLKIERNLSISFNLNPDDLQKLQQFFPDANIRKIDEIEGFHKKIKSILHKEIIENKLKIQNALDITNQEIQVVDSRILDLADGFEQPKHIIEKLSELMIKQKDLLEVNKYHQIKRESLDNIKTLKQQLEEELNKNINQIKYIVNNRSLEINKIIDPEHLSATLIMEPSKYELGNPNDTGTGSSYQYLIIFDLAIFELTNLPILIHDSILFKNINNRVIENIITYYTKFSKQIFISIDEHKKYTNILTILEDKKVIKLDSKETLYIKIWNKNPR
ncbi:MAG: DUF2326 domain-containing protein [Burkholderiales bacterium]|nr:DUF2326 domain-containing protein [Burkholderiales bacterium]